MTIGCYFVKIYEPLQRQTSGVKTLYKLNSCKSSVSCIILFYLNTQLLTMLSTFNRNPVFFLYLFLFFFSLSLSLPLSFRLTRDWNPLPGILLSRLSVSSSLRWCHPMSLSLSFPRMCLRPEYYLRRMFPTIFLNIKIIIKNKRLQLNKPSDKYVDPFFILTLKKRF